MSIKAARINGIEVSVCGVGELPDFAGQGVTHIVSLWDGYEAENEEPRFRVEAIFPAATAHFSFFNDVFTEFASSYPPNQETIQDILNFTGALKAGHYLLVHCAVGISRSAAIAYATLCKRAGPGYEEDCFRALKRIRPSASPNRLIVRFADDLLGREGEMVKAAAYKANTGETDNHE